jgi:uncharacterized protein (DUF58 family)
MNVAAPVRATLFQRTMYRQYRSYSGFSNRLRRRFTPAGFLVVICTMIFALLGLDTNLSVAYQAFAFLFMLCACAFLGARFSRSPFAAQRVLPRFGSVGVPLVYKVELQNPTNRVQQGVSLLEELGDPRPTLKDFVEIPEPGEEKRNWWDRKNAWYRWSWQLTRNIQAETKDHPAPALSPRGRVDVRMELLPVRRGVLRFEALSVVCPDPFGLFRAFVPLPLPQSVLILPKRYPLAPVALPGSTKYQQGGVAQASSIGQSDEFVSLRDYRPGDPLKHIHWKSWAKIGKPIVKEFQDEYFVRHAMILDTFCPVAHSEEFEEAVSVAASFACTLGTQESLLDLMFIGPQAYCFTAGRGLAHTDQMLEILASVRTCHDKTFDALEPLVTRHLGAVSGCICILLAWDEPRRQLVSRIQKLGVPLLVLVVVPPGQPKPDPGPMRGDAGAFHVLETGKVAEALARL